MPRNYEREFARVVRNRRDRRSGQAPKLNPLWVLGLVALGYLALSALRYFADINGLEVALPVLLLGTVLVVAFLVSAAILIWAFLLILDEFKRTGSLYSRRYGPRTSFRQQANSLGFRKVSNWSSYLLLGLALIYYADTGFFHSSLEGIAARLYYNPKPSLMRSPWPWADEQTLHSIIANIPKEAEQTIQTVAQYISQQETDPFLRVKALHDYVINRVSYDYETLETGIRKPQSAQAVFKSHQAVCEGYARLFAALGRAAGFKVAYLTGAIRKDLAPSRQMPPHLKILNSDYDWTLHAWNAIQVAGSWYLIDTTWDDGESTVSDSQYEADYLMPPPEAMISSHFPKHSFWQLLSHPIDHSTFENQPLIRPALLAYDLSIVTPTQHRTTVQEEGYIEVAVPPSRSMDVIGFYQETSEASLATWDLPRGKSRADDSIPCQQGYYPGGHARVTCRFLGPGTYVTYLYGQDEEASTYSSLARFEFTVAPPS